MDIELDGGPWVVLVWNRISYLKQSLTVLEGACKEITSKVLYKYHHQFSFSTLVLASALDLTQSPFDQPSFSYLHIRDMDHIYSIPDLTDQVN
jgi:hypothetical protein